MDESKSKEHPTLDRSYEIDECYNEAQAITRTDFKGDENKEKTMTATVFVESRRSKWFCHLSLGQFWTIMAVRHHQRYCYALT